jgi:hypothetical protein
MTFLLPVAQLHFRRNFLQLEALAEGVFLAGTSNIANI